MISPKTFHQRTHPAATRGPERARLRREPSSRSAQRTSALAPVDAVPEAIHRTPVDLEVIIPARNEECRIARTIHEVSAYLAAQPFSSRIVVVNNGSADRTTEVVDEQNQGRVPVVVIGCSTPGKGAAVRRGVLTSTARFIGFCDADLATPIGMLDTVMPLLWDGAPIVVGSRYAPGCGMGARRRVVRRVGGWAFRRTARTVVPGVYDTQCGFKFFSGPVARSIFARAWVDGFAFDVEVLALAAGMTVPILEVPVSWQDQDRSTFNAARDGWRSFRVVLTLLSTARGVG